MDLHALSDLHVGHVANRELVSRFPAHPDDWLVIAGDVGESSDQLAWALETLADRYAQLVWVPGNHELWTLPGQEGSTRGEDRYFELVDVCRERGVLTPECPHAVFTDDRGPLVLAPLFLLFDYTFRSEGTTVAEAIELAASAGALSADEHFLSPDPYPSRAAWAERLVRRAEARLAAHAGLRTIIVSHHPLRRDLVRLSRPQFAPWCGTMRTAEWHRRFNAVLAVHGHLHTPMTSWRDRVRFEEVSVGYPREWRHRTSPPAPRRVYEGLELTA